MSDWEEVPLDPALVRAAEAQRLESQKYINPKDMRGARFPVSTQEMRGRLESDSALETPVIDPIDFIPGPGLAKVGATAAIEAGRVAARAPGKAISSISELLLGKLAGLDAKQAAIYATKSGEVEALRAMRASNPQGLQDQMVKELQTGVGALKNKTSDLAADRSDALIQKTMEIDPNRVKQAGGETGTMVQDIINKQYPPVEVANPVSEIVDAAGRSKFPATTTQPAKVPKRIPVSATQAERLKESAAKQAEYDRAYAPIAPQARDSKAAGVASDLRKGLEGVAPEIATLNAEMGINIRTSKDATRSLKNNPEKLFKGKSLKSDAIMQRMSESGAPNVRTLADKYQVGQALDRSQTQGGALDRLLFQPAGRLGLRAKDVTRPVTELPGKITDASARLATRVANAPGVARTAQAAILNGVSDDKLKRFLGKSSSTVDDNPDDWVELK